MEYIAKGKRICKITDTWSRYYRIFTLSIRIELDRKIATSIIFTKNLIAKSISSWNFRFSSKRKQPIADLRNIKSQEKIYRLLQTSSSHKNPIFDSSILSFLPTNQEYIIVFPLHLRLQALL